MNRISYAGDHKIKLLKDKIVLYNKVLGIVEDHLSTYSQGSNLSDSPVLKRAVKDFSLSLATKLPDIVKKIDPLISDVQNKFSGIVRAMSQENLLNLNASLRQLDSASATAATQEEVKSQLVSTLQNINKEHRFLPIADQLTKTLFDDLANVLIKFPQLLNITQNLKNILPQQSLVPQNDFKGHISLMAEFAKDVALDVKQSPIEASLLVTAEHTLNQLIQPKFDGLVNQESIEFILNKVLKPNLKEISSIANQPTIEEVSRISFSEVAKLICDKNNLAIVYDALREFNLGNKQAALTKILPIISENTPVIIEKLTGSTEFSSLINDTNKIFKNLTKDDIKEINSLSEQAKTSDNRSEAIDAIKDKLSQFANKAKIVILNEDVQDMILKKTASLIADHPTFANRVLNASYGAAYIPNKLNIDMISPNAVKFAINNTTSLGGKSLESSSLVNGAIGAYNLGSAAYSGAKKVAEVAAPIASALADAATPILSEAKNLVSIAAENVKDKAYDIGTNLASET